MRRAGILILLLLLLAAPAPAAQLTVEPQPLGQGQAALVRLCGAPGPEGRVIFLGRETGLIRAGDGCLKGILAADLDDRPGRHTVRVLVAGQPPVEGVVEVKARDYGERRITVDPKFMRLSKKQLARHQKEIAAQRRVYGRLTAQCLWQGGFAPPVPGKLVGPFGRRSVINGQPRNRHGGVDLRGAQGEPIKAPAEGRVALVQDSFFGGLIVLIDHGLGLVSAYRHLSQARVATGDLVKQGQIIGLVGKSGRVTGPHLHYDLHLAGARVDPLDWAQTSRKWGDN